MPSPTCPSNALIPCPSTASNTAGFSNRNRDHQLSLARPVGCQIGVFVNTLTGEVRWCPCGRWRCTDCGKRNVARFLARVRHRHWYYLATFTLEGDGAASKENIKRLNAGWRTWLRWAQRQQRRKFAFTWVNEQGSKSGRLHKHVLLDSGRIGYRAARAAVVRNHLGRVVDFQRVRSTGASGYIAKYLTKTLTVEWPRYTRRCQTTEPRPEPEEGWTLYRRDTAWQRRTYFGTWMDDCNSTFAANAAEREALEAEGLVVGPGGWYEMNLRAASLDILRESASVRAP